MCHEAQAKLCSFPRAKKMPIIRNVSRIECSPFRSVRLSVICERKRNEMKILNYANDLLNRDRKWERKIEREEEKIEEANLRMKYGNKRVGPDWKKFKKEMGL